MTNPQAEVKLLIWGEFAVRSVPSVVLVGGVRKGQYVSVGRHTADS